MSGSFQLVTEPEAFLQLEGEWNALEAKGGAYVYQSHAFLRTYLECFRKRDRIRLAIVTYREDGALRAIVPLCVISKLGLSCLCWLSAVVVLDHGDILVGPALGIPVSRLMDEAFRLVRGRYRYQLCYVNKVRSDSPCFSYLAERLTPVKQYEVGYIRLQPDFEALIRVLRKTRGNIKSDTLRRSRRLGEKGDVSFALVDKNDPHAWDSAVELLYRQKIAKYRGTYLKKPGHVEWIKAQRGLASSHLSVLRVGDRIAAICFGYVHGGRFTYYTPSYDTELEKYAPGRIHLYYLVQHCCERGVDYFDFGMGGESYKFEWSTERREGRSFIGRGPLDRLAAAWIRCGTGGLPALLRGLKDVVRPRV